MNALGAELRAQFGDIDIYLFDQLHRGRLSPGMRVLDAGCGHGRNLVFLLRSGFDVQGVDSSAESIDYTRRLATTLAPGIDAQRFRVESIDHMTAASESIDFVISSAVLHFAANAAHWNAMVDEMWRTLAPGGVLFARLATSIGQDGKLKPLGDGRYVMPDGSARFLVDEPMLSVCTARLGGVWLDPLKTSVVHDTRSMATWVIGK